MQAPTNEVCAFIALASISCTDSKNRYLCKRPQTKFVLSLRLHPFPVPIRRIGACASARKRSLRYFAPDKAGDGNRTHVSSLEGWCSTIELHPQILALIGVTGFEPATPWSQTRCSSQAEPHPETMYRFEESAPVQAPTNEVCALLRFLSKRKCYYIKLQEVCQQKSPFISEKILEVLFLFNFKIKLPASIDTPYG